MHVLYVYVVNCSHAIDHTVPTIPRALYFVSCGKSCVGCRQLPLCISQFCPCPA